MARRYLFVCDGCGASVETESERLPPGWAIITAQYTDTRIGLRAGSVDICSLECAIHAQKTNPKLMEIAEIPRMLGAGGGAGILMLKKAGD